MKGILPELALLGLAASSSVTFAATQGVIFNGSVASVCVLTVGSNGTMTVSPNLQSLSSHNSGGTAGTANLATTGGVTLSVDSAVTGVTTPAADSGTIAWTPTYAVSGAHNFPEGGASHTLTGPGTSVVTVNLAGTKTGTDTFVAGNYQATVTVRCEP